jgi:hypothetical protein
MPYIGNTAANRFVASKSASVFSGDGSTTAFTLSHGVGSDEDILVSVDGVIQEPSVAYSVSGTTLTFTAAPSSNSGNNIFVYYLFRTVGTVSHPSSNALQATSGTFSGNLDVTGTTTLNTKLATTNLGTGAVLQVVNGTTNTTVSHTTTSFTDTGLSASITPTSTSNKILVLVNQNGFQKSAHNTYSQLKLLRGSTDITIIMPLMGYNNSTNTEAYGTFSTCFLDSPATTSATTYKTQFNNGGGTGSVTLQTSTSGIAESTITLMEIAG